MPRADDVLLPRPLERMETAVVYSDEQWPYEDKAAVDIVDQIVRDLQYVDQIVLIGDQCDFASLSRFVKNLPPSRQENLLDEVVYYRQRIYQRAQLAEQVRAKVTWTQGNHEARLHRYLEQNAPQVMELFEDAMSFESLLHVPDNWEVHKYGEGFWLGQPDGLWITHGHLVAQTAPTEVHRNVRALWHVGSHSSGGYYLPYE
jgi:hypothetical protein